MTALTYNELAKLVEENGYKLLANKEWEAVTKKLFAQEEEVKRLKKLNDKYRMELRK
jgi:hypothetical protein